MSFARPLVFFVVLALSVPLGTVGAVDFSRFGDGNLPDGCHGGFAPDVSPPHFTDGCYHMRTGLNALDTPIIDVLLVTPVSPYAERDLRAMRQAVESWDEGFDHLAPQMGLDWLTDVEFRIFADDDKITTDPAWDPEIIVVMANPVLAGVQGIGIDPLGLSAPCRGANPLASADAWNSIPGFDNHHGHSGTYVEECEGGGTTCYAVNLAIDPLPGATRGLSGTDTFGLVQHEVGHCLTLGHVGDAGDHTAENPAIHDIMAYTVTDHLKCVSSLDVEAFAIRMSNYLLPAPLVANDASNPDGAFQVQHPDEHFYASSTGLPEDCPEPDLGIVPGEPGDFTPDESPRTAAAIDITSHDDGASVPAGVITIGGTVAYGAAPGVDADGDGIAESRDNCDDDPNADQRDRDHDGLGDACDGDDGGLPIPDGRLDGRITIFSDLDPVLAHNEVPVTLMNELGDPRPKFTPGEPVTFRSRGTLADDGLVEVGTSTMLWHVWASDGSLVATVGCTTFADGDGFDCEGPLTLPTAPGTYYASAGLDGSDAWIRHDNGWLLQARAPPTRFAGLKAFEVVGPPATQLSAPELSQHADTVHFQDAGVPANTFFPEDSTLGLRSTVRLRPIDTTEWFTFRVNDTRDMRILLTWTGSLAGPANDLDLHVEGAAFIDELGEASSAEIVIPDAHGTYRIGVEPWLITDNAGVTYSLTVETISPEEQDSDGDGVVDPADLCPGTPPGTGVDADGCPLPADEAERVEIRVDGVYVGSEVVDGRGSDAFAIAVDLAGKSGAVQVTASWYEGGWLVDESTVTLEVA